MDYKQIGAYRIQTLTEIYEIKAIAQEIERFQLNDALDCSFQLNPYVLLAENKRNPIFKPIICIIRENETIACVALGYMVYRPFKLSISIFQIPGPHLNVFVLPLNGLCISKHCDESHVLETFFTILKYFRKKIDIVYLEQIQIASHLWQYTKNLSFSKNSFFQLIKISPKTEINSWHVLLNSYEEWYGSLGRKTKKRLSWEMRRFKNKADQPVFVERINKENQVRHFLENVEKIRDDMWQTKTFGRRKKCFNDDVDYFKNFARHGWLRSYLLLCNDKPAAYEIAVQYGRDVIFLERGYIQSLSKIGPGTYLTYIIMKDCYEGNKPYRINFGYGENEFKKRLRTDTSDACYAYLTFPNKGRKLTKIQQLFNFIEIMISQFLFKTGLDNDVRRVLKRKN